MLKNLAMVLGLVAGLTACMGPYGSSGYGNTGYGYSAGDSGYRYIRNDNAGDAGYGYGRYNDAGDTGYGYNAYALRF
jgi:hypothetical protein